MRGEREDVLDLRLVADSGADSASRAPGPYELAIARRFAVADRGRPGDRWLLDQVRWAWRTKIKKSQLRVDLRMRLSTPAEDEAVRVFGANLRDLLLAAPAGARATMGRIFCDLGLKFAQEQQGQLDRNAAGRFACRTHLQNTGTSFLDLVRLQRQQSV